MELFESTVCPEENAILTACYGALFLNLFVVPDHIRQKKHLCSDLSCLIFWALTLLKIYKYYFV